MRDSSSALTDLPVTLEITPPVATRPAILLRRALALSPRTRRVNVIDRDGRWSSLAASTVLVGHGFEPVWHLANRGRSVAAIESDLATAAAAGISRVLCMRGERKSEDADDTPKIREVVRAVLRRVPGARVSVTFNPFAAHTAGTHARALANLDAKLDAGASAVQTQVSFDLESLRPFAEHVKARRPDVAISPMLMPVESARTALRISRRLGVPVPPGLIHRLEQSGPDAGWDHFEAFARAVADSARCGGLWNGLAVMTPIDPRPSFVERLRALLG